MRVRSPMLVSPPRARRPLHARGAAPDGGFTLIEALIATALLGFSLIVMFGFHNQAVRSNMHARKMTDCTYLAQLQMERLMSLPWTNTARHADLQNNATDSTSAANLWVTLEHPSTGAVAVNAAHQTTNTLGEPTYFVSWDVEDVGTTEQWVKLMVRCQYRDDAFNQWHGTTVSSFRFRDL
jgi:Tfp pilus assembly protein PilV